MNRKMVSIQVSNGGPDSHDVYIALADDGTAWHGYFNTHKKYLDEQRLTYEWETTFDWEQLPSLPQNTSSLTKVK